MKIKLLKKHGLANPGDIISPAPPIAKLLIERGAAKMVISKKRKKARAKK